MFSFAVFKKYIQVHVYIELVRYMLLEYEYHSITSSSLAFESSKAKEQS